MTSAPQLLADLHQLGDFDSGEPSLDDWLKRLAAKSQANRHCGKHGVVEPSAVSNVSKAKGAKK